MAIRIPFLSKSERGRSLQRCLDFAAEETSHDAFTVARVMSKFVEALADELALGHAVLLPGFGRFAPLPIPERHLKMSRDKTPRCKPVFAACRGLRQQVGLGAAPSDVQVKQQHRYNKNHANTSRGKTQRVYAAQPAFRDQIHAQLGNARR